MKNFLNRISPRLYILLSGILLGFTVIFAKVGILAYIAMIPLAAVIYKRINSGQYKIKSAYLDGFIFYMSFDLVAFHWFTYFYPLDFAGLSNAESIGVIILAWVGLSLLQSVFSALVFVIISLFSRTEICRKCPILLPVYAAALWAVNEWTQTLTWAGVPWGRIAISQTEMPVLMQSASLFGSYFLTFVIVLVNFLLAYAIIYVDKRRLASLAACGVFLANVVCGTVLYLIPTSDGDRYIKVASVQGNISSQEGTGRLCQGVLDKYQKLSREAAAEGAELIIWSEGTFPKEIEGYVELGGKSVRLTKAVSELASDIGATVVIGSYVEDDDGRQYNSLSTFYPDGTSVINAYSKMRPVPFGEYLPLADLVAAVAPSLAEINIFGSVTPGEESTVFGATAEEDAIKVGSLICFDSIYEELGILSSRAGAEMLIVPSNDSWFYDSRALNMHHSQNILRAVEQGKYTVNCGNTGMTSIVSDKGRVIKEMPIYTDGYVIDTVYASSGRTLYSYIGNLFVYVCAAAAVAPFVCKMVASIVRKRDNA